MRHLRHPDQQRRHHHGLSAVDRHVHAHQQGRQLCVGQLPGDDHARRRPRRVHIEGLQHHQLGVALVCRHLSLRRGCHQPGLHLASNLSPVGSVGAGAINEIGDVEARLRERRYIGDRSLATAIFLALKLDKPLFIEGEAGVGKTEAAKVMAEVLDARLIRLQCYEGIDLAHAVYEWNYPRQLLHIRLLDEGQDRRAAEREIFSPEFLMRRPLLDAIDNDDPTPPVLLIDEIDRSDEEFEAFLLELLSDFQVSIPEIGTIKARQVPFVVITSNRTREVHDALKRRCLYHWIDYPNLEKEVEIVRARAPEAADGLAREVAALVQGLRGMDLYKVPGVAETLDWARALAALGARSIATSLVDATLGAALKYQEDLERVREKVPALVEQAKRA